MPQRARARTSLVLRSGAAESRERQAERNDGRRAGAESGGNSRQPFGERKGSFYGLSAKNPGGLRRFQDDPALLRRNGTTRPAISPAAGHLARRGPPRISPVCAGGHSARRFG